MNETYEKTAIGAALKDRLSSVIFQTMYKMTRKESNADYLDWVECSLIYYSDLGMIRSFEIENVVTTILRND